MPKLPEAGCVKPVPASKSGLVLLIGVCRCVFFSAMPRNFHRPIPDAKNAPGAFNTSHYRNLFVEGRHPAAEVSNKINAAFQQLFHGDPTNQAVYYIAGANSNGPLAYVTDIKHHDVRTEGLSYGMMIAVQMNQKALVPCDLELVENVSVS